MEKDRTLQELLLGHFWIGCVVQLGLLLLGGHLLKDVIGLWCGIFCGVFCLLHMQRTLEDSLDLGEEYATKQVRKGYVTRMLLMAVVLGLALYYELCNPITLLVGVLVLKSAIYLQSVMHKVLKKINQKGG